MKSHPRVAFVIGVVAVAATVLAACSPSGGGTAHSTTGTTGAVATTPAGPTTTAAPNPSGAAVFNGAVNGIVNPSTKQGGTLNLLAGTDCDSWDPQRTYYGWCWNMQRLFTRSLMGYSQLNGDHYTLAPDLATSFGKHNANYTVWTYTLKPGLKFSNGMPIRPIDVKYGIERLFATDVINGGPSSYFIDSIAHPKNYKGPYKSGDLSTIVTKGNSITFHLSTPNADWNYLMAMAASAPVPYKVEGGPNFKGATYTKHPVASGPFMIQSYTQNKQITFVRNPYWKQSTDTIHHPLVNKVVLTVDTNLDDIDQKLQAGTADARADNGVQVAFQAKILTNPTLKAHADDAGGALTRYMAVIPSVIPNVHCRRAIFYAFDKAGALRALGGPTNGVIAHSMTPPGVPGYDPSFNPYPSGSGETGDVAKAKAELTQCGKPHGFTTKFAYATPSNTAANLFKAEQQALGRVGIKITADTSDASTYYSTFIGSPANLKNQGIGLADVGWGQDYPTLTGFYNSMVNGKTILSTGNSNYASLNDPVINKILAEEPAGKTTVADTKKFDQQLMKDAVYLPYVFGKTLYYRNPRMTNVTCDNNLAFGIYDFVNVGVG
ncbi:MAG: ABC transporter substrate-binding protein, partial [Mycobacterium sp.]|nr:ABC transporter substrate-binding protein [Mycobacterium sp.]